MRTTLALTATLSLALAAACGGSSNWSPEPLQHHLDDMHLARVPVSAKQDVIRAQNDHAVARMEHENAKAELEELDTRLKVARNERERALLAESSAESEKEAADRSNDMNRINRAARTLRASELERRAADEKVEYLKLREEALKAYVRYTGEDVFAKEARYEYAKARVARAHDIRPQDFDYNAYKQQAELRQQRALEAKARADRAEHRAAERREAWQNLQREAQRMRGGGPPET